MLLWDLHSERVPAVSCKPFSAICASPSMLHVGCSVLSFSNCCCVFCASFCYLYRAGVGNKLLNLKHRFSTSSPRIPALECCGKNSKGKASWPCFHTICAGAVSKRICASTRSFSVIQYSKKKGWKSLLVKTSLYLILCKDKSRFSLQSKVSLWWTPTYRFELITSPQAGSWQLPRFHAAPGEAGFCPAGSHAALQYSWSWW